MNLRKFRVFIAVFSIFVFIQNTWADDLPSDLAIPDPSVEEVNFDNSLESEDLTASDDEIQPSSARAAVAAAAASPSGEANVRREANDLSQRIEQSLPEVTNNGAFSYNYPINAPAFRGLETKLALNYNSSRKTKTGGDYQGWLGYGWGLSGVPIIERAGFQQGVPHYTDDDIYLLNGEPLVACNAASVSGGASCGAGGNWVSEVENHLKIKFISSSTNPIWEVTARDGTKTTFSSVGKIAGSSATSPGNANDIAFRYRWLVKSIADTKGNKVVYDYSCPSLPVCYPKSITYQNVGTLPSEPIRSIDFYYEDRPDYITSGNGHSISIISQRIKTILINTSGDFTRGYKISYSQAPLSEASRLTSVQEFGSDLTKDSTWTITGGTALPSTDFSYNNATGFGAGQDVAGLTGMPYRVKTYSRVITGHTISIESKSLTFETMSALDVNSDGVTEILRKKFTSQADETCSYNLLSKDPASTIFATSALTGIKCTPLVLYGDPFEAAKVGSGLTLGHFGNDKKQTQLLLLDDASEDNSPIVRWQMMLTKNGTAFARDLKDCQSASTASNAVTDSYLTALCDNYFPSTYPLDKDGNARSSLAKVTNGKGNFFGDGREQTVSWSGSHTTLSYQQGSATGTKEVGDFQCKNNCVFLDLNGDGLDDVIYFFTAFSYGLDDPYPAFASFLFTGDTFVLWTDTERLDAESSTFVSDVDGDGKAELGLGTPGIDIDAAYVAGYEYRKWKYIFLKDAKNTREFLGKNLNYATSFMAPGDFNGDGQTDLLVAPPTTIFPDQFTTRNNNMTDFNSAGYAKALYDSYEDRNYQIRYGSASGGIANLLNAVTTSQGGQAKAVYAPSTVYQNSYLVGFHAELSRLGA